MMFCNCFSNFSRWQTVSKLMKWCENDLLMDKWVKKLFIWSKLAKLQHKNDVFDEKKVCGGHTCRNTRIWGSRLLVKICLTSPGGGFDVASKTFDVAWEHLTSPERLSTSSDRIYSLHSIPLIHYNYVLFLSYSL